MAKGDIVIDELGCTGCGYCVHFCVLECIVIPEGSFTSKGYPLPVFADSARCTGCGVCGWMCPQRAIEVYRYTEEKRRQG